MAPRQSWQRTQQEKAIPTVVATQPSTERPTTKRKLSYLDAREYASIEERIARAEELLQLKHAAMNDPAIASDASRLLALSTEIEEAQRLVNQLYERWAELEDKKI